MKNQKDLILDRDWDYLVILDACRYDIFEEVYDSYLEGNLVKVKSPASQTIDWLKESWSGFFDDLVYISSHPTVNSMGIERGGFKAKDHFHKIEDVWDYGWNEELGVVPPREVTRSALNKSERGKDFVVHYMQPHLPYLSLLEDCSNEEISDRTELTAAGVPKPDSRVERVVGRIIVNLGGRELLWSLKRVFNLRSPPGTMEMAWRNEGVLHHYKENLKRVLNSVSHFREKVEGDIAVTSDHGEMLGENGKYGHEANSDHPVLREVPWLRVD